MKNKPRVLRSKSFIWVLGLMLLACQSREIRPKGTGTEYFPLKVGSYWLYDMVETQITQLGGQSSTAYQLMVVVSDSIVSSGQTSFLWQRSKRTDATQPWVAIETWSSRKDAFQAIVQEGNTSYIKLEFPLANGKTWNANALNNLGGNDKCTNGTIQCDNFEATNLSTRFEGSGVSFEDTVTIMENNENDPIVMQDLRKSVYAKSIGLVYHEESVLEYCTVGDCIGKQIVQNGTVVRQTVKDYGVQ